MAHRGRQRRERPRSGLPDGRCASCWDPRRDEVPCRFGGWASLRRGRDARFPQGTRQPGMAHRGAAAPGTTRPGLSALSAGRCASCWDPRRDGGPLPIRWLGISAQRAGMPRFPQGTRQPGMAHRGAAAPGTTKVGLVRWKVRELLGPAKGRRSPCRSVAGHLCAEGGHARFPQGTRQPGMAHRGAAAPGTTKVGLVRWKVRELLGLAKGRRSPTGRWLGISVERAGMPVFHKGRDSQGWRTRGGSAGNNQGRACPPIQQSPRRSSSSVQTGRKPHGTLRLMAMRPSTLRDSDLARLPWQSAPSGSSRIAQRISTSSLTSMSRRTLSRRCSPGRGPTGRRKLGPLFALGGLGRMSSYCSLCEPPKPLPQLLHVQEGGTEIA